MNGPGLKTSEGERVKALNFSSSFRPAIIRGVPKRGAREPSRWHDPPSTILVGKREEKKKEVISTRGE